MKRNGKLLSSLLVIAMCFNLLNTGVSAVAEVLSTNTQTSSAEETVYVDSFNDSARTMDFSNYWRFYLGDGGSAAPNYDDSEWRTVDLPHDYSIEQDFYKQGEAESGYLPGGTGWYRKSFTISPSWKDKTISIDFGGIYMNATVYLNGQKLGFHPYGYTAFSLKLPNEILKADEENVVAVKVEHRLPSSRWYSGSGIYRSVHLTVTDPVHVAQYGTYLTTPELKSSDGKNGKVQIETTVQNDKTSEVSVILRQSIYESGDSKVVLATAESPAFIIPENGTAKQSVEATVSDPKLWSPDTPNLYFVRTEVVVDGQTVDTHDTDFGFRYTDFNNTEGFVLNGQPTKLKGVCMHHDQGSLGAEAWYRAMERQVEILKEMGCNAIRVTHNPAAKEFIDICNRKGMLVIDEAFDMWVMSKNSNTHDYALWFEKKIGTDNAIVGGIAEMTWAEFDLKAMAHQDKNAPAVIMYSLGNEIFEGTNNSRAREYPGIARKLCTWLQEVDATRPPTFGQNTNNEGVGKQVGAVLKEFGGISGVNYADVAGRYDSWVNAGQLVYHSETASAVNSRGIYDRKNSNGDGGKGDYLLTSYDKSKVNWGAVASDAWMRTLLRDSSMGEFVWTGFDYIGEPTPWNGTGTGPANGTSWPNAPKSSYFGIIDTNGLPKDSYYLYQSLWNDAVKTLHILPTWNRDEIIVDRDGNVEVVVYSDAPKVKLFLNDTEVAVAESREITTAAGYKYRIWQGGGETQHQKLYATFQVKYKEGTLKAVAYDEHGQEIQNTKGRSMVTTTTTPAKLRLMPDRPSIQADGDDLSYITIDVTDDQGRIVNSASTEITLSIIGNGKISGVDNGRQPDHTSYQSLTRKAGAGRLVAVVQSTNDTGSFTVKAEAVGLAMGETTVQTTGRDMPSNSISNYTLARYHYVKLGEKPVLPETVKVTYRNGTSDIKKVSWNAYEKALLQKEGSFSVGGVIEGTDQMVVVNVTMLSKVAGLLNYSVAVPKGANSASLPKSRPLVLMNGKILSAEFPVEWDESALNLDVVGTQTVKGTSTVFGEVFELTATIRVAEGKIGVGGNVAPSANAVTQDVPAESQGGLLTSLTDRSTDYSDRAWTNKEWAGKAESNKISEITFTYATVQDITQVAAYYFTDREATALPDKVSLQWSATGGESAWSPLSIISSTEPTKISTAGDKTVYRVEYNFAPVSALVVRLKIASKDGKTDAMQNYCTGLTEVQLNLASRSFPIHNSDALSKLTVNGIDVDHYALQRRSYSTEATVIDSIVAESAENAAITILPAHENVVRVLTESEDHTTRGVYEIQLGAQAGQHDPEDGSRDYPYNKTTATAPSYLETPSGNEGGPTFANDGNAETYWHSNWKSPAPVENPNNLILFPDKRYIQLTLEEEITSNGVRYLPRPGGGNGSVVKARVDVSTDGEQWDTVVKEQTLIRDARWKLISFSGTQVKYIRFYGIETWADASGGTNKYMSAAELRVCRADDKQDLSAAEVTMKKIHYDYTGSAIQPHPEQVQLGAKTLKYGVDYLVEYSNNIQPGTATLTVRGIVKYSGAISKEFTIDSVQLTAKSYTPVEITTQRGVAPVLPGKVTAQLTIGSDIEFDVKWDDIKPEQYKTVGRFTVQGTVQDQQLHPVATVLVVGPITVQRVSAATEKGSVPVLPPKLNVYFTDGSAKTYPVQWDIPGSDAFKTTGKVITVSGTVTVDAETVLNSSASVRIVERKERSNIALNKTGRGIPFAMASHGENTTDAFPKYMNNGARTESVGQDKQIWCDWVKSETHESAWAGIILNDQQPVLIDEIKIGFIDEASSGNTLVGTNAVRLPSAYKVQYYTGTVYDYDDTTNSSGNSGRSWKSLGNDANWRDVVVTHQDEITSGVEKTEMLSETFMPVRTGAIRVMLTPQAEQWVGVDELEVYGSELELYNDFNLQSITLDDIEVLADFDTNKTLVYQTAPNQPLPVLGATVEDGKNAALTVVQSNSHQGTSLVIVTSEDGTQTDTYTIRYKNDKPPQEPKVYTIFYKTKGGSAVAPVQIAAGKRANAPTPPTRRGYSFTGWYTDGDSTVPYDFTKAVRSDLTLYAGWSSSSSSSSGSSGRTDSKVELNPDGSKTDITTDLMTGTVTKTTVQKNGSKSIVETQKDGTITTTDIRKDGIKTKTIMAPSGNITAQVNIPSGVDKTTVIIPTQKKPTISTVAVIMKPDGSREIVKTSLADDNGVKITLNGSATLEIIDNTKQFNDVQPSNWYNDAVLFVTSRELFKGTGDTSFTPNASMTRGMLVTVLHRLDNIPNEGAIYFGDVNRDDYYADAVAWASVNGIVKGVDGRFQPDVSITREQIATILYRYARGKDSSTSLDGFADSGKISSYAIESVSWAVQNGILQGDGRDLRPQAPVSRAEVSAILQRFVEQNTTI